MANAGQSKLPQPRLNFIKGMLLSVFFEKLVSVLPKRYWALFILAFGAFFAASFLSYPTPSSLFLIVLFDALFLIFTMLIVYMFGGVRLCIVNLILIIMMASPTWASYFVGDIVIYHSAIAAFTCCFMVLFNKFKIVWLPFLILILGIPVLMEVAVGSYKILTGQNIGYVQLFALYDTNFNEALEYLKVHSVLLFCAGAFLSCSAFLLYFAPKALPKNVDIMDYCMAWIIMSIMVTTLMHTATYHTERQIIELMMFDTIKCKERYEKTVIKRKSEPTDIGAKKRGDFKPGLFVVVIGESANRNHMHMYGYFRDNTPKIEQRKNEITVFNNVISSHSATTFSLRQALTLASADSGKNYYDDNMFSMMEILRNAGIKTHWLSNQSRLGLWGSATTMIASSSDDIAFVNEDNCSILEEYVPKGLELSRFGVVSKNGDAVPIHDYTGDFKGYDQTLLEKINLIINSKDDTAVIFVHLMGSHSPYKARYPKEFEKFKEDENQNDFGKKVPTDTVNAYDNSIYYTDYVLDQIIEMLEKRGGLTSLMYFSDHGESVFLNSEHDPSDFSPGHVEIPFFIWYSDQYKKDYENIVKEASRHTASPLMLDSLPNVIMDWTHITGPFYKPANSPLNSEFSPSPRKVIDGTINYDSLTDTYWSIVKEKTGFSPPPVNQKTP